MSNSAACFRRDKIVQTGIWNIRSKLLLKNFFISKPRNTKQDVFRYLRKSGNFQICAIPVCSRSSTNTSWWLETIVGIQNACDAAFVNDRCTPHHPASSRTVSFSAVRITCRMYCHFCWLCYFTLKSLNGRTANKFAKIKVHLTNLRNLIEMSSDELTSYYTRFVKVLRELNTGYLTALCTDSYE